MAIRPFYESIMIAEDRRIMRIIDATWEHHAIIRDGTVYLIIGYDGSGSDLKIAIDEVAFSDSELISLINGPISTEAQAIVDNLNKISKIMNS